MKKVFVPLPIVYCNLKSRIPIDGAEETYLKKMVKYDLLPMLISPILPLVAVEELYEQCDGAYFLGGDDIDPINYNEEKQQYTTSREGLRDKVELTFLKKILSDRKPFLGICRGCQTLTVASNGTLMQHIPDHSKEIHHYPPEKEFRDVDFELDGLWNVPKHEVILEKDSLSYSIMKKDRVMVNSGHHQAVVDPGENIRIVGKSPGGIPEILEHKDQDYFCIAVQSHPEIEEESFFEPLFAEFARRVHAR